MSSAKTPNEVLSTLIPFAQQLQRETGVPASVTLAQYIQESGLKPSGLAKNYNNLFGVKAGSSWKGKMVMLDTWEEVNGKKTKTKAPFRVYNDLNEAFKDRGTLLTNKRYGHLIGKDPETWAYGLYKAGYATDSNYPKALLNHIQKYNLTKYDRIG